jgi:uncharacterized membrane protein
VAETYRICSGGARTEGMIGRGLRRCLTYIKFLRDVDHLRTHFTPARRQPREMHRKRVGRLIDFELAIAIHVLAVVLWIGGVAMVTTVVLPAVRQLKGAGDGLAVFEVIERRFGWQARGTVLLAGASGFYMVYRLNLWREFISPAYWWLDAMVAVWLLFTIILFVAEPLFLHCWLARRARHAPDSTFALVERAHWILLVLSLVTIIGAVIGSRG